MSGYMMDLRKVIGPQPLIMAAASVIVVDADGRMLFQHRRDNNYWGLPGGAMELGESFEETTRREVFEETGLMVGRLDPFYLHSGRNTFYVYPDGNQVYIAGVIFKTTEFSGDMKSNDNESLELVWFFPREILPDISPLEKPVIEFYIEHT